MAKKTDYQKYFEAFPKEKVIYFTTDGMAFINKNKADNHQMSITGKRADIRKQERNTAKINKADELRKEELEKQLEESQNKLLDTTDANEKALLDEAVRELKVELEKLS